MTGYLRLRTALPFVSLGLALVLCAAAFVRSEQYRAKSDLNYSQTYEVQWRTTQIREHLARVHGQLRLAAVTGRMEADLRRQVFLLNTNVDQLLKLEYASKFLGDRDIELLRGLQTIVGSRLDPIIQGDTDFEGALQVMPDLEQRMFEVSGTAVAHSETLNRAVHIAEAASRNRFLFAAALAFAAVLYTIVHLGNNLARKQERHLRSFSSLYAHMTRTRVAALKLFLSYQDKGSSKHPEMLVAAKEAAEQLEVITNGLSTLVYANKDTRREKLTSIIRRISNSQSVEVKVDFDAAAAEVQVPAAPMRLILGELVHNAEAALDGKPNARIEITANIKGRGTFRSAQLLLAINDNGPGMPPEVLDKVMVPFFSTRAGPHTGLGLTGCAQLLAALRGRFTVTSQPGKGTSVIMSIPLPLSRE